MSVRGNRVKEYRFSETLSSTTTGSFVSDHVINGEILEVDMSYVGTSGSVFMTDAGNARTLWTVLDASGATAVGIRTYYPRALTQLSTGSISVAAGAETVPFNVHDKLVLNAGSMLSGANPLDITVRYR